ncbi:heavy-metal-associated domain-containing protein [Lacibacter sediminis]|uniref:Heavy-metal-associated domain-containing protein n=1 Tax=Lacibacter sediminis TaxID=2760713 RepID=A0A7G5XDQ2_9BACT|nr:heavy-metal-associated domain-containing protein [Lacibacter sediminis]QNA43605.1 heavy-metal-associated domain-containing protein [Lacibacter sediminis]
MKKFMFFICLLVGLSASAQFKSATLQASGLTCAMCSNAINKSLKTLSFISSVESDIKTSSFVINFKEGADINFDQLRKKVEDAGFSVAKLQVLTNFNNVAVQNEQAVNVAGKQLYFLSVKNQQLSGEKVITIVDKNFLPAKEYKKYAGQTKAESFKTGESNGVRVYHVTI